MTDPFIDGGDDDTEIDAPPVTVNYRPIPPGGAFGQISRALFGEPDTSQADHMQTIRRSAEREAAARALQQQAIAFLIIVLAVEVLVLVPLLVWGLFSGEVW